MHIYEIIFRHFTLGIKANLTAIYRKQCRLLR